MPPIDTISGFSLTVKSRLEEHFPFALNVLRTIRKHSNFHWRYHSRPDALSFETGYTKGVACNNDIILVDRLISSYLARSKELPTDQWWEIFQKIHGDIHEALITNDRLKIEEILRNPVSCDLFYGFDSLVKSLRRGGQRIEDKYDPTLTFLGFLRLSEALGVRRMDYPENYTLITSKISIDDVIDEIESFVGFELEFPQFYPKEFGIVTKRGIASYRVPQAIYQAFLISKFGGSVCEIGGGLGRTAFYARAFGVKDYTIVDIPISSLAQGYFLGRSVGTDYLTLQGEVEFADNIKLLSPNTFFESKNKYDLILNVDSLTELGNELASKYLKHIVHKTQTMISINHEQNDTKIIDEFRKLDLDLNYTRHPYWLRRGYVEEVYSY